MAIDALKKLTGKKHIFFTDRGNTSIKLALKLAKDLNKKRAYIQDQGGWITYEQYLKELKFEYYLLDTNYGLLSLDYLKKKIEPDSVLLINSMPGYFCLLDNIKEIHEFCKEKSCILINDVSGSIGKDAAKHGEIIIGSFGRWKPINLEYGGFIGYDNKDYTEFLKKTNKREVKDFSKELDQKLAGLNKRLSRFKKITKKVKQDLYNFDIIHKDKEGINIIARYNSPKQRLDLENYCKLNSYEFTLCPRYIRVNVPAVSVEIKRL